MPRFALLELCQSVLWAKAAEGTCDGLSASLVRLCSACLAAQPLAVAFYAHHRRRHLPGETVPPTRLLMELSAAYLLGSLATAGGGASVQGLLASLFPLAPDAPLPVPPPRHGCASLGPHGGLQLWDGGGGGRGGGASSEAGSPQLPWWMAPDALAWSWGASVLVAAAVREIYSSRRAAALPAVIALSAQALLPAVLGWDGTAVWSPAGLCLAAYAVIDPLVITPCCAPAAARLPRPASPQTVATCVGCGALLAVAAPLLATHHVELTLALGTLEPDPNPDPDR
eukprot:scaffold25321_cov49-Phaeocystis_antarctica.AAC.1